MSVFIDLIGFLLVTASALMIIILWLTIFLISVHGNTFPWLGKETKKSTSRNGITRG